MKNCICVSLIWQFSSLCWCSQDYDVCFFGLRHCGRRCCARFFIWIYNVCKTRINFSMRVFVFCFEAYWKLIFQWESLFLWFQHYWKLIFEWEYLFFWPKAYWKLIFQWKSLFFFGLRPIENWFFNTNICFFGLRHIENWFFNENVCFFGVRHCGRRCCARFFHMNLQCF